MQRCYLLDLRFPWLGQIQPNTLQSLVLKLKHLGSAEGKVDNAARYNWTAIVDPDENNSTVVEVRHPHPASQRKGRMGSGQIIHVIGFAAGRGLADKVFSIPRSSSHLIGLMMVCLGLSPRQGTFHRVFRVRTLGVFRP